MNYKWINLESCKVVDTMMGHISGWIWHAASSILRRRWWRAQHFSIFQWLISSSVAPAFLQYHSSSIFFLSFWTFPCFWWFFLLLISIPCGWYRPLPPPAYPRSQAQTRTLLLHLPNGSDIHCLKIVGSSFSLPLSRPKGSGSHVYIFW